MLATDWRGDVPEGGLVVQQKIDGIRALWLGDRLITREGSRILGVDHIAAELRQLQAAFGRPMMMDAELQVDGALRPTTRHFQRQGRDGDAGRLHLFDAIPIENYRQNDCTQPLTARLSALDAAADHCTLSAVGVLPWRILGSVETVRAAAERVWATGGEGLVIKAPVSTYHRGRSRDWLKVKLLAPVAGFREALLCQTAEASALLPEDCRL